MDTKIDKKHKAARYFEAHKNYWYDPSITVYAKAIVRIVELHRSDSKGWLLSVRYLASRLGVSQNTIRKAINEAMRFGLIEANQTVERKHRKLRLSASLRAPVTDDSDDESFYLHQPLMQSGIPNNSDSASSPAPINNKVNIKANNNESLVNQNQIDKSIPYKEEVTKGLSQPERLGESEGFRRLRERAKRLGWKEKS